MEFLARSGFNQRPLGYERDLTQNGN